MNVMRNIGAVLVSEEMQDRALKTVGLTSLAAISAYGGTFFFTRLNPMLGVAYLSTVTLTSHVAYQIFERLKEYVDSPHLKQLLSIIQLTQIPLVFYALSGPVHAHLSQAVKLEIIVATGHFVAIPIFFYLAIEAWQDPTFSKIAAAGSFMVALASGLKTYIP